MTPRLNGWAPPAGDGTDRAARVGGALLLTGGSLAIVLLAVGPGFVHGKTEVTLSIASVAILVGLYCLVRSARMYGRLAADGKIVTSTARSGVLG